MKSLEILFVFSIWLMVVAILHGVRDIEARQAYTTCADVGLGERKATTVHPKKGTIIIYCDGAK